MLNKVQLIGNLGQDPQTNQTSTGTNVTNFNIATTERWNDKATGERKERTEWHRIVVWGNLASICAKYLSKGRQVYVEGSLQTREWTDTKTGQKRWTTEVRAQEVKFLGTQSQDNQRPAPTPPHNPRTGEVQPAHGDPTEDFPLF